MVQEDSLHDKNVKHHFYFVDLGILRLYENELFYIASEVFGNSLPSGLLRTSPTEYDIKIGELDRHSIIIERFLTTDKSYSYSFDYDEYIHTELIPRVVKRTMNFHYDTSVLIEKLQFLKNRGKSFNLDEVYSYIESIKNHVPDKKDIFPIVFLGQCGNCWNN